jgi:hypothetical protein
MLSHSTPQLLDLAPELVENVIKQVGNWRDLSNLRLASKALDEHAAKELFRDVYLSPEEIDNWSNIASSDTVRRLPRHAIIHTQPDIEDDDAFLEREEISEEYETALAALSRFPNLDSVEIGFTPNCIGQEADMLAETAEDVDQREHMLKLIFQAIQDRAADDKNRKIRKLTIINLQNCPLPEFTSSDLFRDVMGQLEELHIQMIQEYCEHGPDYDYDRVELRTWPAHFCSHWLAPISANLRALSIYSRTDNWGPFPGYFDPSGLSFPKLETLALGYYTLAHDNDINWILATKSLRKLILHNCMIASWLSIASENMQKWQPPTHDWTRMPEREGHSDWNDDFTYAGTWSQHLDRIAESLPHLTDFRFDQSSTSSYRNGHPYGLKSRDFCTARIFPKRYIAFDNGILPTHWPEAQEDGERGTMHSMDGFPDSNLHVEHLEADQKSLDALLSKLRQPRR